MYFFNYNIIYILYKSTIDFFLTKVVAFVSYSRFVIFDDNPPLLPATEIRSRPRSRFHPENINVYILYMLCTLCIIYVLW